MVRLGCTVPDHCQNLNFKSGESEQNIPRVVGRITRRGTFPEGSLRGVMCMINLGV